MCELDKKPEYKPSIYVDKLNCLNNKIYYSLKQKLEESTFNVKTTKNRKIEISTTDDGMMIDIHFSFLVS